MKTLAAITLLLCSSAFASPGDRPQPPKRHGPPPEAIDACKGKADGTAVEMKTPRGDVVKGTCRMVMIPERDGPGGER
jgi:hypothetical protein